MVDYGETDGQEAPVDPQEDEHLTLAAGQLRQLRRIGDLLESIDKHLAQHRGSINSHITGVYNLIMWLPLVWTVLAFGIALVLAVLGVSLFSGAGGAK